MKIAVIYSFLAGFSLILGVIIGTVFKINQKVIAAIMAFGSGVLICALTFGLMEEAFKHGGFDAIAIGFLIGGIVSFRKKWHRAIDACSNFSFKPSGEHKLN